MCKKPVQLLQVATESSTAFKWPLPLVLYANSTGLFEGEIACNTNSFPDAASFADEIVATGVPLHHVDISREINPIRDSMALIHLVRLMRAHRYDIVHTHNSKAGILGRFAASLAGIPIVVHTAYDYGALIATLDSPRAQILLRAEKWASQQAQKILFIAEHGRQTCYDLGLANPHKAVLVGVGIDYSEFDPTKVSSAQQLAFMECYDIPRSKILIGTLARLMPHKGIDTLLKAARLVLDQRQDAHFIIAGGGPLGEDLEQLARDLGIDGYVTFTGFLEDQSQVPVYMSILTIFWLATRYEGFGLVYTEANAMGVPVIGSRISPVDYVIGENVGGLLADSNSPVEFANACLRLLNDDALRRRLAVQGSERGRQLFDINAVNQRIVNVYRDELRHAALNIEMR